MTLTPIILERNVRMQEYQLAIERLKKYRRVEAEKLIVDILATVAAELRHDENCEV